MGFITNSLQIENVTPEKAREYLSYNYAHNRRLRPGRVQYLVNEMREGRFMPTAEIHIMYCNGEPVLVNGQHTCNAIAMYGKPMRLTVRKTSTNEHGQVAMMYAYGHDTGMKRTFSDGLGAYNIGEELGIGSYYVDRLAAAVKFIRNGFRKPVSGKDASLTEIVEIMHVWAPYARAFLKNITVPSGELTRIRGAVDKQAVFSVLLITYRYSLDCARDFWSGILSPGLLDTDARWYARRVIEESILRNNRYALSSNGSEVVARRLAKCWGSFVSGKQMGQIPRISDINPTAPIAIAGTPFNGRQSAPPWLPE